MAWQLCRNELSWLLLLLVSVSCAAAASVAITPTAKVDENIIIKDAGREDASHTQLDDNLVGPADVYISRPVPQDVVQGGPATRLLHNVRASENYSLTNRHADSGVPSQAATLAQPKAEEEEQQPMPTEDEPSADQTTPLDQNHPDLSVHPELDLNRPILREGPPSLVGQVPSISSEMVHKINGGNDVDMPTVNLPTSFTQEPAEPVYKTIIPTHNSPIISSTPTPIITHSPPTNDHFPNQINHIEEESHTNYVPLPNSNVPVMINHNRRYPSANHYDSDPISRIANGVQGMTNVDQGSMTLPSGNCGISEFECVSDHSCIPRLWVCDSHGSRECPDGSDEDPAICPGE